MMKENNKIEWVQVYRGGGVLLVVFGHIIWFRTTPQIFSVVNDIIYLFHMPAFFALSGYLFGLKETNHKPAFIINKKLIQLGIPYLLFSILYFTIKFLLQNIVRVETNVSLNDFLQILFFPNVSSSVYWFLFVLILYFIIFSLTKEKISVLLSLTILSILAYIIWKSNLIHLYNDCFEYFIGYAFCFSTGMLFGHFHDKIYWKNPSIISIFATLVLFFILFAIPFAYKIRCLWHNEGKNIYIAIVSLLLLFGGCSFIGFITILISKTTFVKKMFMKIGEDSWYIYLLHPYFLNITRNLLVHIEKLPSFCYLLISLIAGTVLPLIFGIIIRKVSLFDFAFYPYKYIKPKIKED